MIFHIRANEQGGAWAAGGEGEAVAGEVGDSEEAVSPVGLLHPPDAGDKKVSTDRRLNLYIRISDQKHLLGLRLA